MNERDYRALIALRDDMEEQEDRALLRRTLRHIETLERAIGDLGRALARSNRRVDTDT